MDIQTISSEERVEELFEEWRALQFRVGRTLFTDPGFFAAWWDMRGRSSKRTLHVTVGRDQGRLVALAPLIVVRRYGFRFLEWAGVNVFDYSDTLLDDHVDGEPFWHAIRNSKRYDVAFIRGVRADFSCYDILARFGHSSRTSTTYRIDMAWASGEAWMEKAFSRTRRQLLRRKQRRIERRGMLSFRVHRSGPVPDAVLNALVQQKSAWALRQGEAGLFDDPLNAASLLKRMAEVAEQLGYLHLSWLNCDEQILAVHLGFMHRNVLHYYMPSYDPNWGQDSPGSILLVHLVQWCIDNKIDSIDFMRGDDSYKRAYANARIELTDFSFPGSLKGKVAELAVRKLYFRGKGCSLADPVKRAARTSALCIADARVDHPSGNYARC